MHDDNFLKEVLFPFSKVRNIQSEMIKDVYNSLRSKQHMIMHAPTGIGKTVAVLAPALSFALSNGLSVFFLTSRHTQHWIAIETLRKIKSVYGTEFGVSDIVGKKGMCLQQNVSKMFTSDFHEYCKNLREEEKCEYYSNTRKKNTSPTPEAKIALDEIKRSMPYHVKEFIETGESKKMCPYELAVLNAEKAKVIVADYYYIFSEYIRDGFLLKTKKNLEKSIVIVDEGHNLPARVRDLLTQKLSNFTVEMAMKEAKKLGYNETLQNLQIVNKALLELSDNIKESEEKLVDKNEFREILSREKGYDDVSAELNFIGEEIREQKKRSFVLAVGRFLEAWPNGEEGFCRIAGKKKYINLSLMCLDPSISTQSVIAKSYSTILMSGTLTPTSMYKDTLGFPENTIEKEYPSPFPDSNRMVCVLPKTTTQYSKRNNEQFRQIANNCAEILDKVNGCSIVFCPSYELMRTISWNFREFSDKTIFSEKQNLTKEEKDEFLSKFKSYKNRGAVLFAVSSGSFGEGIDLPGILSCIIVAGLPLQKPDLEVRELIKYYDSKFGNGWDYGYVLPAITKCMQNAGRCIRSEKDKGVIVFLDERYAWSSYFRCFPKEWGVKVSDDVAGMVEGFFGKTN